MICPACFGKPAEEKLVCPECGGTGVAHCCDGLCAQPGEDEPSCAAAPKPAASASSASPRGG